MYVKLLEDGRLFLFLLRIDQDLAEQARQAPCPRCGGRLHRADYPRKPRGEPAAVAGAAVKRRSFCCAREGCRGRVTPPSLRFLGRRVYGGAVFVLVCALRHGGAMSARKLQALVGVSVRTLARWRRWWQSTFAESSFWQAARGLLKAPLAAAALPQALLAQFAGRGRDRLLSCLKFLAPLSTSCVPAAPTV